MLDKFLLEVGQEREKQASDRRAAKDLGLDRMSNAELFKLAAVTAPTPPGPPKVDGSSGATPEDIGAAVGAALKVVKDREAEQAAMAEEEAMAQDQEAQAQQDLEGQAAEANQPDPNLPPTFPPGQEPRKAPPMDPAAGGGAPPAAEPAAGGPPGEKQAFVLAMQKQASRAGAIRSRHSNHELQARSGALGAGVGGAVYGPLGAAIGGSAGGAGGASGGFLGHLAGDHVGSALTKALRKKSPGAHDLSSLGSILGSAGGAYGGRKLLTSARESDPKETSKEAFAKAMEGEQRLPFDGTEKQAKVGGGRFGGAIGGAIGGLLDSPRHHRQADSFVPNVGGDGGVYTAGHDYTSNHVRGGLIGGAIGAGKGKRIRGAAGGAIGSLAGGMLGANPAGVLGSVAGGALGGHVGQHGFEQTGKDLSEAHAKIREKIKEHKDRKKEAYAKLAYQNADYDPDFLMDESVPLETRRKHYTDALQQIAGRKAPSHKGMMAHHRAADRFGGGFLGGTAGMIGGGIGGAALGHGAGGELGGTLGALGGMALGGYLGGKGGAGIGGRLGKKSRGSRASRSLKEHMQETQDTKDLMGDSKKLDSHMHQLISGHKRDKAEQERAEAIRAEIEKHERRKELIGAIGDAFSPRQAPSTASASPRPTSPIPQAQSSRDKNLSNAEDLFKKKPSSGSSSYSGYHSSRPSRPTTSHTSAPPKNKYPSRFAGQATSQKEWEDANAEIDDLMKSKGYKTAFVHAALQAISA